MNFKIMLLSFSIGSSAIAADDIFLKTLAEVESKNNPSAIGDLHLKNHAYGLFQMRAPAVLDVNRAFKTNYIAKDALDPVKAKDMASKYLSILKKKYEGETGKKVTPLILAKMWNGGPNGYDKASTKAYGKTFVKVWAKNVNLIKGNG